MYNNILPLLGIFLTLGFLWLARVMDDLRFRKALAQHMYKHGPLTWWQVSYNYGGRKPRYIEKQLRKLAKEGVLHRKFDLKFHSRCMVTFGDFHISENDNTIYSYNTNSTKYKLE